MKRLNVTRLLSLPRARRMVRSRWLAVMMMAGLLFALTSYTLLAAQSAGLQTQDMTTAGFTAETLADVLVGSGGGVTVSNAVFTGNNAAAGKFSGGAGIIGFDSGIILSTGNIAGVVGPNTLTNEGTDHQLGGDAALNALATQEGQTGQTKDAAVLTFDFVPNGDRVFFDFVFASEEYPEFVHSNYNDVFAFYVNDVNCALVNGQPVSINTINNANPIPSNVERPPNVAVNPDLFVDNKQGTDGSAPLNTQMDGLTGVLNCSAPVNPGVTNTLKLAIADTGDGSYDSNVFIKAGSLTTTPPTATPTATATTIAPTPTVTPTATPAQSITVGLDSSGDVHIMSPDGLRYDFQEVGDFILAQSTTGDVKLHARQEAWPTNANVSVNTAAALWVAGDKLVFNSRDLSLKINDELTPLPASTLALPAGGRIEITSSGRAMDYTIIWPDGNSGARVIYTVNPGTLNALDLGIGRLGGSLTYEGVLGNLDGNAQNDLQIRGGELITPLANPEQLKTFGDSWRVPAGESLFDTPQPATAAPEPLSIVDLPAADRAQAEQTCQGGGVSNPTALQNCTFDVAVTGEDGFVASALAVQESIEQLPTQQDEPVAGVQGQTLEVGQQYAVGDVPGTFRYFQLVELPSRPGAQAILALCPEQEALAGVNVSDVLSPEGATAQGLAASNEPCTPVEVAQAAGTTDEATTETTDETTAAAQEPTLEVGQQYAVEDVPGTFRYFQLRELPGQSTNPDVASDQALMALCPELEELAAVNASDIMSPEAAMAQGLTASNEPCTPVDGGGETGTTDEVAPETVEEAVETDVTPEAVVQEDTDTAAPAESQESGGIGGICSAPLMMPLFIGFGMIFMKVSRRRR